MVGYYCTEPADDYRGGIRTGPGSGLHSRRVSSWSQNIDGSEFVLEVELERRAELLKGIDFLG